LELFGTELTIAEAASERSVDQPRSARDISLDGAAHERERMDPRSNDPSTDEVGTSLGRRAIAFLALAAMATTVLIALVGLTLHPFVIVLSSVAVALALGGVILIVTTAGARRFLGGAIALVGVVAWIWILVDGDAILFAVAIPVGTDVSTFLALLALRPRPYRPPAREQPTPSKPFILMNPRSGGGKMTKFELDTKARAAGAEVCYLEPGTDAEAALRRAVESGADLLGAAGGDGTQALVAKIAVEHDLPILCIPAGTRNHFALDLGLDRKDPSLTLGALGDEGEEILIDLGWAGDRPFVNNVSLGAYAEIVARPGYRDAKFTTAMAVLPDVTEPSARSGLIVEADGEPRVDDPQLVQVANNPYAGPDDPSPAGTRPRLDTGRLGVDVVAYRNATELGDLVADALAGRTIRSKAYRSWTGRRIRISARAGVVHAGVDGETVAFPSPLEIAIAPAALRIRVPRNRPGPKVGWPRLHRRIVLHLWSIAIGRS
jgi:diacylglycerol kinase family enzyme